MTPFSPWRKRIEMPRQRYETVEIVHRKKIIDKWKCSLHASCERLIARGTEQWIQPDQTMTRPLQSTHFCTKRFRIAAIPSVGNEKHDCSVIQNTPAPLHVESAQGIPDSRSAGPVGNVPGDFRD